MAETVIKTVEDVDKLFSQIVVNGETYDSDRYVPPQAPLVIPETPVENEVTESPETESPSEVSSQGEDVHAVDLNNVLHNFVDPQEVNNRESADATLQSNIDNITSLIPSDTTSSNKLVNEAGLSDSIEDIVDTAVENAVANLDVPSVGGNGKYIASISETDGKISATEGTIDTAVTSGSSNPVTGGAVDTALQSAVSGLSQDISDAIGALDVAQSGGSGKYIASISETDGKISATEGTIDTTVTQGSNNPVTSDAVNSAIESAIASVYKPAGNKTCAELVSSLLVRANLGNVYNITDSGTTTSDFAEGAGKPIKAGDNVAIVDVGTSSNPSYKFDLLSGMIDLSDYIKKSQTQGLVKNDGTIDTTAYAKQSEMSVTPGTGANADKTTIQLKTGTSATVLTEHIPAGTATPQMDGVGNAGSSTDYSRADHVHPSDTTKQDKTLATALTIDGSVKTTVEDALSALNSAKLNSSSVTGTVESGNSNPVTSDAVNSALNNKVDKTTTVNGHALSSDVTLDKGDVGLGNVGNFKAVSTVASQGLTDTEKANARANIGAGTSSFSGSYNDLTDKPTLGTASGKDSTDTVTQGSTDLVESGAVAEAIQNVTDIASSLPTDAVLHYSFDEVPDLPDGTRFFYANKDFVASDYNTLRCTVSDTDGKLKAQNTSGNSSFVRRSNWTYSNITGKIFKVKIYIHSTGAGNCYVRVAGSDITSSVTISSQLDQWIELSFMVGTGVASMQNLGVQFNSTSSENYFILESLYIGDGSYVTPVIDNANGQNNAVNNGGIAVQGVSGKGAYFLNGKYAQSQYQFDINKDFAISFWVKPDNNTTAQTGYLIRKNNQFHLLNGEIIWATNALYLVIWDTEGNQIGNYLENTLLPVKWSMITLTRNGNKLLYYRDGIKVKEITINVTLRNNDNATNICHSDNTRPQTLDNLLIFDRALSEKEVLALYQNKANTPKYYDLNDYRIENADTAPAENSTDLITSGAVYEAMQSSGSVKSVCSQSPDANGNVELTKADIGLGNVANTGDSDVPSSGGTAKFTTGGAFDFFGKSKSASSWLGKVFGKLMGRKWAQVTGDTVYFRMDTPVYANGLWLTAVNNSNQGLWWSEDGKNWTRARGSMAYYYMRPPVYSNGLWIAGSNSHGLWWSEDGKNWTQGTGSNTAYTMNTPVYSNGLWIAGSSSHGLWWSEDGKSWTQVTGETSSYTMNTPVYSNGLWIAGSNSHGLWWSEDGKNWTQGTGSNTAYTMNTPVYANGLWVAGSTSHGLWWSEDGKAWTQVTGETSSYTMNTPVYSNGLWIAGGLDGLWWSEYGKNWTQGTGSNTAYTMNTPVYSNGLWIAGGVYGLWWSENGKDWIKVKGNVTSYILFTPFYANGLWLAGSEAGLWYSDIEMALEELTD